MDLETPKILKVKGLLFLVLGVLSGTLLLMNPTIWQQVALLAICIWAFCRFYYFAFYVLQHYADPDFRYSGLLDLASYLLKKKKQP